LLNERDVAYRYRDYKKEPLDERELRSLFAKLDLTPRDLLRRRDRTFRDLGLTGDEPDDRLIQLMAQYPTLLERPIGVLADRAIVGRPPDRLLELVGDSS
jgi:arsenate reductase